MIWNVRKVLPSPKSMGGQKEMQLFKQLPNKCSGPQDPKNCCADSAVLPRTAWQQEND